MIKKVVIYFFLFLSSSGIQVFADEDGWIRETIDFTINTNFKEALRIVTEKIEADSNDYRAQFYLAATLNSKMTHFESQEGADLFNYAIDKTLLLVEEELENNNLVDSIKAELLFYQGSAYGYRAFFQGNNGNFLAAVSNGLKSVGALNQTLQIDSTLYGAYLGIGVYKYWRYSRLKFISWLPFVPDDREEGIAMIKIAIARDSLSRYMAMHQLVYILLDYGRYEEAKILAERITEKYPDSQFMWWANAHAYFKSKNFNKAKASYLRLYNLILEDKDRNISHLLKCKFKLALVYKELQEFDECKKQCDSILEISEKIELTDSDEDLVTLTIELSEDCNARQQDL
jgi:tetratricopeptide (TPR) repeat protein